MSMVKHMQWNKYPEMVPPADDMYLAVVEFDMRNGTKERSVMPAAFAHDFEGEHRPGWWEEQADLYNECYNSFELNVVYWMPYPDMPKD